MNFLQPKSRLRSHIVVIRGYEEPDGFLKAAKRQIEKLNIKTDLKLIAKLLEGSEYEQVNKYSGIKATVDALKEKIAQDLSISNDTEENQ